MRSTFRSLLFGLAAAFATAAMAQPCIPPVITGITNATTACSTDSILLYVTATGTGPLSYLWSGAGGIWDTTAQTTAAYAGIGGTYHVTVSNACGTAEGDVPVTAVAAPNAGYDVDTAICDISTPVDLFFLLGGTPDGGGTWTLYGAPHSSMFDPNSDSPGYYTYTVTGMPPCYASSYVYIAAIPIWFEDADNDGYGDPNVITQACIQPAGYVANSGDYCPSVFGTLGSTCDDGNPNTTNDTLNLNCVCVGTLIFDCLGIVNGPNQPGTSCTDSLGTAGTWSPSCICIPNPPPPCVAGFLATQAYDSTATGGVEPIPNEVWIYNLSSGGNGSYGFEWNFGDGDSSFVAYPTHEYAGPGPYTLCLTMYSGGCTDTYCDSVSIDANGILNGMVIDGHTAASNHRTNGFTLNVIQSIPTGVVELPAIADLRLWPNPAQNELNLSFNNTLTGTASVTVIDPSGRMVISESHNLTPGSNTLQLNTGSLEPGLYMVRIGNAAHNVTHRFMKLR